MIVALPDKPWQVALIDQDKGNMIDVKVNLFLKKKQVKPGFTNYQPREVSQKNLDKK